jgi:hypothetical protein
VPTYTVTRRFRRDLRRLTPAQRTTFRRAVQRFVEDLGTGSFRPGLRVKRIQGAEGIFEMSWAPDGRATFEHGPEIGAGGPDVIWRRVGTRGVLADP